MENSLCERCRRLLHVVFIGVTRLSLSIHTYIHTYVRTYRHTDIGTHTHTHTHPDCICLNLVHTPAPSINSWTVLRSCRWSLDRFFRRSLKVLRWAASLVWVVSDVVLHHTDRRLHLVLLEACNQCPDAWVPTSVRNELVHPSHTLLVRCLSTVIPNPRLLDTEPLTDAINVRSP